MRNIRKPVYRYLFNSLNTFNNRDNHSIGLYSDHKIGRKVLCLNGFQILGDSVGSDATTDDPTSNSTTTYKTYLELAKSQTDDGVYKGVLVRLDNSAPASTLDWPYALSIVEKVKLPNVHSSRNNQQQKTYSGIQRRISITGTTIDDTYIKAAEDDIITQIKNDEGLHINNTDPVSKMSGAVAYAYRYYKITVNNANTDYLLITPYLKTKGDLGAGGEVQLGTAAIASAHAINNSSTAAGNTTIQAAVKAWVVPNGTASTQTQIIIASRTNGLLFDVEDGPTASTNITIEEFGIMLKAKNVNVQFEAKYDINTWTSESFYMVELTQATAHAATYTIGVVRNGVLTTTGAITEHETEATWTSNANTALHAASPVMDDDICASYDAYGAVNIFWGNGDIDNVVYTPGASITQTLSSVTGYDARYPSLTPEDVFRVFWNQKGQGTLSAFGYMDQPEANTDYVCYYIKSKNIPVSDVIGAGYNTTTEVELELYVKKSIVTTSYWDLVNSDPQCYMKAAGTADTSLEGLLTIFAGPAPSAW